jgi:hypothetical protein
VDVSPALSLSRLWGALNTLILQLLISILNTGGKMKTRLTLFHTIVVAAALILAMGSAAFSWDKNQYPKNTYPFAMHDLLKLIEGKHVITEIYTGGPFKQARWGYCESAGQDYTWIYWYGGTVEPGDTACCCFSTQSGRIAYTVYSYWSRHVRGTVENYPAAPEAGVSIEFDHELNASVQLRNDWTRWEGADTLQACNLGDDFDNIAVGNLYYAVTDYAYGLDDLNAGLWDPESPLTWFNLDDDFDLAPADSVVRPLANIGPNEAAHWLLVRYEVESIVNDTDTLSSYVVFQKRLVDEIPALTEWGLLVLAIMVLASGVWVFRQRRRTSRVKA